MKFLSYDSAGNFGFVQSGGSDVEVVTPYSLAESKELQYDQNNDVMYIAHNQHPPMKLTRTSATAFTLATYVRTDDPFDDPSSGTVGYPACVRFFRGRLGFAAPTLKPTNFYLSKGDGSYDDFTTGTEDDDAVLFQASDISEPIEWMIDGVNSLLAGSAEAIVAINGQSVGEPITPATVQAKATATAGASVTMPIKKDDLIFYIHSGKRSLNYFRYDILSESFKANDVNFLSYDITEGRISQLVYKKDKNDLIYTIRGDGALLSMNFNEQEKILAWHAHERQGTFTQISEMLNNEGDSQLFALIEKGGDYFICRQSSVIEFPHETTFYTGDEDEDRFAQIRLYAEKLKECNYLDISSFVSNYFTSTITYVGDEAVGDTGVITSSASDFSAGDVGNRIIYKTATGREIAYFTITGYTSATEVDVEVLYPPTSLSYSSWYISFNTISGLTDFIGDELSVVSDGGYSGDFTVDGSGEIALGKEVTVACVGFSYEGLIKTFVLGMNIQGVNLQTTLKSVYQSGVRFIASAGGEVGTSLYDMTEIQEFDTTGLYDSPPNPMNGTEYVKYNDSADTEKCLYLRQASPLPFNVTALMTNIKYSTTI
ncbi:MAG: hypothetical protein ACTSUO_10110 [Candidatus Thorarchaeota archaeon]